MKTRLAVRVTPHASSNAVIRYQNSVLYLRLTAPPVDGVANAACCAFVAELLGLRPAHVTVSQGHKSRDKVLEITGLSEVEIRERMGLRLPHLDETSHE
jgi:uncharacterized protein YggU (UPF0235/DUF167 family)